MVRHYLVLSAAAACLLLLPEKTHGFAVHPARCMKGGRVSGKGAGSDRVLCTRGSHVRGALPSLQQEQQAFWDSMSSSSNGVASSTSGGSGSSSSINSLSSDNHSRSSSSTSLSMSAANEQELIGEDAAVFSLEQERGIQWVRFLAVLITVLGALDVLWINPDTGFGDDYIRVLESLVGGSHEGTITLLLGIFAVAHSGLAGLRAKGEDIIGARAWRVLFGVVSLPLALSPVVYFINHRYDGTQLWDVRLVPGVHEGVFFLSALSFLFLYPSTFNLLEVAAVDKPKLHMWETGIMRITRHPQFVGQAMWCLAHSLYIGTSFTLLTSALLMAHHAFSIPHGDRRLGAKYGEAFEQVKARTSVVPFQAVWEGRQTLPDDYWKEFARGPYLIITAIVLGAYVGHPFLQGAAAYLNW